MDRETLGSYLRPISSTGRDIPVGRDEAGNTIYQTITGHRYTVGYPEPEKPKGSGLRIVNRVDEAGRYYHDVSEAPSAPDISRIVAALTNGFKAPGRALSGHGVTMADVLDTAGMVQLGAAAMPAPRGALRSGAMRSADDVTPAQAVARMLREGNASGVTDDLMARADPAEMQALYGSGATGIDMPMDDASRLARARGMYSDAARRAVDDEFASAVGLRTDTSPVGWTRPSREWSDGTPTGNDLGGVSATTMRGGKPDAAFAAHGLGGNIPYGMNSYADEDARKYLSLVYGDTSSPGDDMMEVVIPNAHSALTRNRVSARFDPRLAHLANLSAGIGSLLMLPQFAEDETRKYLGGT